MKLMADFQCFPLWEYADSDLIDNVSPENLPLTTTLKADLLEWASAYDKTLNPDYPPESGFASLEDEENFENEGKRLWNELKSQLGTDYKVVFFSNRESCLFE